MNRNLELMVYLIFYLGIVHTHTAGTMPLFNTFATHKTYIDPHTYEDPHQVRYRSFPVKEQRQDCSGFNWSGCIAFWSHSVPDL
jgi:hypothetical protein